MPDTELKVGSIILVPPEFLGTAVEHYCVVLTSTQEIASGQDLVVAGCSTSSQDPFPNSWVRLDGAPGGHPVTGLSEATIAKADWHHRGIPQSAIIRVAGRAPSQSFKVLRNWLLNAERDMLRSREP